MNDVEEFYMEILNNDIDVINFVFQNNKVGAMSVCNNFNQYLIAIDEKSCDSSADVKSKLYHEFGHCKTDAFYNLFSPNQVKQKCEYRADRYVAQNKITKEKIEYASKKEGCTEAWEFAEYFNVTVDYMKRILKIHYGMEFME